ncbi:MAG: hypothetical protein GZ087_06865 [Flavobacterium sp.]|nr:hypothetical protein [Flavobacterium sp.]
MKFKFNLLFAFLVLLFTMQSCSSENEYGDITNSTSGSNASHNAGQNCMNCHKPGGGEAPQWKVAGTVYNDALTATNPQATVKLYTGPDGTGTLIATLPVDAKGNFYTTNNVNFSAGLYPLVAGATATNSMSSSITTGACNSCHDGVSRSRIWAN